MAKKLKKLARPPKIKSEFLSKEFNVLKEMKALFEKVEELEEKIYAMNYRIQ